MRLPFLIADDTAIAFGGSGKRQTPLSPNFLQSPRAGAYNQ